MVGKCLWSQTRTWAHKCFKDIIFLSLGLLGGQHLNCFPCVTFVSPTENIWKSYSGAFVLCVTFVSPPRKDLKKVTLWSLCHFCRAYQRRMWKTLCVAFVPCVTFVSPPKNIFEKVTLEPCPLCHLCVASQKRFEKSNSLELVSLLSGLPEKMWKTLCGAFVPCVTFVMPPREHLKNYCGAFVLCVTFVICVTFDSPPKKVLRKVILWSCCPFCLASHRWFGISNSVELVSLLSSLPEKIFEK